MHASMFRSLPAAILAVSAGLLLAGCVDQRPSEATCPAPHALDDGASASSIMDRVVAYKWLETAPHRGRINILLLSGGGAWGAYGAGFLAGWSERTDAWSRPDLDIVTGVSTGAIMAPFALLGRDYDNTLRSAYRGLSADQIFSRRSVVTLPFWDSLATPQGLQKQLRGSLTDDAIERLNTLAKDQRTAWAGAVNFDTGSFSEFDLSQFAADLPPQAARDEIVDHIMAASAVPAALPPRFLGGCMFMDGGVRENLFIGHIGSALDKAISQAPGVKPEVAIYVIVNGPVDVPRKLTGDSLLAIGQRAIEIQGYQLQLNALRTVFAFAQSHRFHLYWTSADDIVSSSPQSDRCQLPPDEAKTYTPAFTACAYDHAFQKAATSAQPWNTAPQW